MRMVFIIGAARSGTKFLRDVLAASPNIARVPYDVGYVWRRGNESLPLDEIEPESVSEKDIEWIRRTLPRLAEKSDPKPAVKFLVEKSVPNSLRPMLLHRAFPNALFIHLVRDGFAVTESAMRMWQAPTEKTYLLDKFRYFPLTNLSYGIWFLRNRFSRKQKNGVPLWGPRYREMDVDVRQVELHQVCARQWRHCVEISHAQLRNIPESQRLTVRYENLISNAGAMVDICRFIGVDEQPVLEYRNNNLQPNNDQKWKTALSKEQIESICQELQDLPAELQQYSVHEASC